MRRIAVAVAVVLVVLWVLVYLVQALSYKRAKQFVREHPGGTVQYSVPPGSGQIDVMKSYTTLNGLACRPERVCDEG
jgi:hypothetical protein